MGIFDLFRRKRHAESPAEWLESRIHEVLERGPFPKCGGCGREPPTRLELVADKKGNHGYLCAACASGYAKLLRPDSVRNFWMCGACGFRVLAGTEVDASVDERDNACPCCDADVNLTLVNLSGDRPIASGMFGEPVGPFGEE
jgi:hypothetical protein